MIQNEDFEKASQDHLRQSEIHQGIDAEDHQLKKPFQQTHWHQISSSQLLDVRNRQKRPVQSVASQALCLTLKN